MNTETSVEEACFTVCPYCGCWNEVHEIDCISHVKLCFNCDIGFNFNPNIEET